MRYTKELDEVEKLSEKELVDEDDIGDLPVDIDEDWEED